MAEELSMDQTFLKQLDALIETHLEDEQFGVEELAKELGLSRSQLHRKLNSISGKSTSQYIREYRLEKAMEMLQNDVATASEIAYRVGFGSPTYFNTSFNKYYGYPPGEVKYRTLSNEESKAIDEPGNSETVSVKRRIYNLRTYAIGALALILVFVLGRNSFVNSKNSRTIDVAEVGAIENSIAVLPFKNMSGNPENEAFCDGMTTAIISRLSKIKGINRVISQTSVMSYKDQQKPMNKIATELDVHYILEAGFQKSGNDIKINLQLIDGTLDKLIWSQEYDGQYESIFKIQAEVAEMVANQLNAGITDTEKIEIQQRMTNNLEAYENFLRGEYLKSAWSANKLVASRKYYEKAIELDSMFVEAYISLGITYSFQGIWFGNVDKRKADSLAVPYYEKAIEIDPNNSALIYQLGVNEFFNWNFKATDSLYQILRQRKLPSQTYFFDITQGRFKRAIENAENARKAYTIRPEDFWVVYAYLIEGQNDTAVDLMGEALKITPIREQYYDHFGNIYLALKDYEVAKDLLETGLQISDKQHASMVIHLALAEHYLGNKDKSLKLLNEIIQRANSGEQNTCVFVAHYYARLGKNDEAFNWLDKAYKKHEVDLIWLKADPNLRQLADDPRYKKLVKKMGFLEI